MSYNQNGEIELREGDWKQITSLFFIVVGTFYDDLSVMIMRVLLDSSKDYRINGIVESSIITSFKEEVHAKEIRQRLNQLKTAGLLVNPNDEDTWFIDYAQAINSIQFHIHKMRQKMSETGHSQDKAEGVYMCSNGRCKKLYSDDDILDLYDGQGQLICKACKRSVGRVKTKTHDPLTQERIDLHQLIQECIIQPIEERLENLRGVQLPSRALFNVQQSRASGSGGSRVQRGKMLTRQLDVEVEIVSSDARKDKNMEIVNETPPWLVSEYRKRKKKLEQLKQRDRLESFNLKLLDGIERQTSTCLMTYLNTLTPGILNRTLTGVEIDNFVQLAKELYFQQLVVELESITISKQPEEKRPSSTEAFYQSLSDDAGGRWIVEDSRGSSSSNLSSADKMDIDIDESLNTQCFQLDSGRSIPLCEVSPAILEQMSVDEYRRYFDTLESILPFDTDSMQT